MKKFICLFALATFAAKATSLTGAGASFPQPLYAQWAHSYHQESSVRVNYQSIGSSGGVKQIIAKTVDFGASDAPLSAERLNEEGLLQFPMVIGGVVPVVNIKGVEAGALKLTGEMLADIYLGKITHWNDAKITALNEGLTLPDAPIVTVFRADGSGTSFVFTTYLGQASAEWQEKVGAANTVKWPTSQSGVAGKGNEGVSNYVSRVENAIGYVEYAFAKQNHMAHVQLQNAAGVFVSPSQESFAAAADVDWQGEAGFARMLTNQPGEKAWPIAAATFILVHQNASDADKGKATLAFFDWAYNNGDDAATSLDYVPLPARVKDLVRESWQGVMADGKAVYP